MKKDNLKYYIVLVVILTPVSYFNIIIHKNAQSAGLRSLVAAESGLQQPMQRMCNMQVSKE